MGEFGARRLEHPRAFVGEIEDLAVDHRQNAAGIGPGRGNRMAALPPPTLNFVVS